MKKRIFSLLLAVVLCIGLMPGTLTADAAYIDVPETHWSYESVCRATELGIFNGVGDGLFGCGQAISRAEFVTALTRLFGWELATPEEATFADVSSERWYFSAVETAVVNGAVPVSSKNFRPTDALTRSEMAAMLMRALGYTSLAGSLSAESCPFTDVTVNRGFITMAYDMGIVTGVGDGRFEPNAPATREQAAVILVRLYDRLSPESKQLDTAFGNVEIRVETPEAVEGDELPTTPLEPIAELYAALREMKTGGQDMSKAVLVLRSGGVSTIISKEGEIYSSTELSKARVDSVLARADIRLYYSQRYESAYCVYEPNYYQTVTVWYQSEESMAAKLRLAKMFGVTNYILE